VKDVHFYNPSILLSYFISNSFSHDAPDSNSVASVSATVAGAAIAPVLAKASPFLAGLCIANPPACLGFVVVSSIVTGIAAGSTVTYMLTKSDTVINNVNGNNNCKVTITNQNEKKNEAKVNG